MNLRGAQQLDALSGRQCVSLLMSRGKDISETEQEMMKKETILTPDMALRWFLR